jgi:hypothetical protein
MSPFSWPVLIGTLVVGSPALYAAQVSGTLSPDVALVRLLICMAGVWLVCAIVASLVESAVTSNNVAAAAEEAALAALSDHTAELPVVPGDGLASDAA